MRPRLHVWLLHVTLAVLALAMSCKPDPSDAFFEQGVISQLRIRLEPRDEEQLRHDPRHYVACTVVENDRQRYEKMRVKLKGSGGSTRELDDRPGFTLSLKKSPRRFHGLAKFHLNNSVQDESFLHELVASQICAAAGCPTARVTHARVWLNDRDLGLYVLKEGYDEEFLSRHFNSPRGNLYDGGDCQEIDAELEKDAGPGPDDRSDLKSLVDACSEPDLERRWQLIEQRLDVVAFLNFMALEQMLCHWDGYTQGHNNYRIYFRAEDNKACFFPHGMDQILDDPNYAVDQPANGLVARAVLENPAWSAQYRARVEELLPLFAPQELQAKIDAGRDRILSVADKISKDFAGNLAEQVRAFRDRASQRQQCILHPYVPQPIEFNAEGWTQIEGWEPRNEDDARLEEQQQEGRACLLIEVGPSKRCTASFRAEVLLVKGAYRLQATVKTIDVAAVPDEKGPGGAGVRISGAARENQITGSTDWQTASHDFQVEEESRTAELIVELRSSLGSALFDISSLRVVRVQ